jgi:phenylpyruvate tautomerase PptA (4-oxalocrotonate tautomerase family)
MPTYTCTAAAGLLDAARKAALARAVTRAHCEVTGAPTYFAQVVFQDVAPGDHFIGGVPLGHDHVFVYGRIRGGRSAEMREALIRRLVADVAVAAGVEPFGVWVYLLELPPAAMAEFGHVLPEAGSEAAWTDALPAGDRARIEAIRHG